MRIKESTYDNIRTYLHGGVVLYEGVPYIAHVSRSSRPTPIATQPLPTGSAHSIALLDLKGKKVLEGLDFSDPRFTFSAFDLYYVNYGGELFVAKRVSRPSCLALRVEDYYFSTARTLSSLRDVNCNIAIDELTKFAFGEFDTWQRCLAEISEGRIQNKAFGRDFAFKKVSLFTVGLFVRENLVATRPCAPIRPAKLFTWLDPKTKKLFANQFKKEKYNGLISTRE